MRTELMKTVKDAIRNPYAWPGGYEKFAVTNDGACLCPSCLKENFRLVCHETLIEGWEHCGWSVAAIDCMANAENVTCDHCGRDL